MRVLLSTISGRTRSGGSTISFAWLKHDVIDAQCRIRRNGRKAV
jgi:hypothetical protein